MRFKSVLGAFLFFIVASLLALVIFIQTKSFGNLVTKVVTDLSERAFHTKVKIKNISLSLFPPGLELNRVAVSKKISDVESFEAELGKIGFYVRLIEVEEKKLTFGEIKISDSFLGYTFPKKEEELNQIDPELINKIFDTVDSAPIRVDTLILENTHVFANYDLVDVKRLKAFKKDDSFVVRFHLANIKPMQEKDLTLDEIWGDGEISRKNIEIYRLRAQHDVHTLLLKGEVQNYYKLKGAEAKLIGEMGLYLDNLENAIPLPEMVQIQKGEFRSSFTLNYQKGEISSAADLYLENIKSNLFLADEVKSAVTFEKNKLTVKKLDLRYKEQKARLLEPALIFNLNDRSYLTQPLRLNVENLQLSNAIRILGPSMDPLHGELNGNLNFRYHKGALFFTPDNNFLVKKLALVVGSKKDPFTILSFKPIRLRNSEFAVVNKEFQMHIDAELPQSKVKASGYINNKNLHFDALNSQINLEDFGNIANLDIKGAGTLDVTVNGPLEKTTIAIKGKTKGFEILGYKLDETEKDLLIDLDAAEVVIRKMESKYGSTHISGNGTVNYKDLDIALGINSNDANSSDLAEILTPIFKDIDFLPKDLDYRARVDVDLFGKTRMDDLKLRAKVNFSDLKAYGETITKGSFNISLKNRMLGFSGLDADKGKGNINGDLLIGLKDKSLKLNYQWENLELSGFQFAKDIGLNLHSTISGRIGGGGYLSNYSLKLDTTAFNTRTTNYNFNDSSIAMEIRPQRIIGKANLLGDIINTDFNLSLKPGLASRLHYKFDSDNIKPFLVAFFGQHLDGESFTGRVHFEGKTTFENGFHNLDLEARLKELVFNHPDFNIDYHSDVPQFLVKNSKVEVWDLSLKQPHLYITTNGEGTFGEKVSLVHEVHLNSKILEILFSQVLSSEGFLRNVVRVEGRGTDFNFSVSSKASGVNMNIERVPVPITDLAYGIEFSGRRLVVENLSSAMEGGKLSLKGDVFFDSNQPDVNLKFILDKAQIPILGKSSVNVSGEGIILGNTFPYTLGGEIIINNGHIYNELTEFSSKTSAGFADVRYLPKGQESNFSKMFTLNLTIKAENPIRITNSLMDVALKGEVRLLGSPTSLRGEGRIFAPPGSSRIFFKNNEYVIQTADINFNPKKPISNPDFDISAVTIISTYKVYPKAYGDLERFNFDLTSDPGLPRNSILSLIAFGYTQDIQSSLKGQDQQSLTQVGVGSFVFDRFKISDILNKQFGLQINLGTVMEQSGTDSLLTGRSGGNDSGQGQFGRTRSATKIELRKRLDEALTLSVSSTMGGTMGQRQSMNLNYGLSKNIQVEGVYELRTNEEGQSDLNYNSIGGDIKFRRTFK